MRRLSDTRLGNPRFVCFNLEDGAAKQSPEFRWGRPRSNLLCVSMTLEEVQALAQTEWQRKAPDRDAKAAKLAKRDNERATAGACRIAAAKAVGFTPDQIAKLSHKDRINADSVTLGSHTRFYGTYTPADFAVLLEKATATTGDFRELDRHPEMESPEICEWVKSHR